jgi:hypothetical protein
MTTLWSAEVTEAMVAKLNDDEIAELIDSLDDAVANICHEMGVN